MPLSEARYQRFLLRQTPAGRTQELRAREAKRPKPIAPEVLAFGKPPMPPPRPTVPALPPGVMADIAAQATPVNEPLPTRPIPNQLPAGPPVVPPPMMTQLARQRPTMPPPAPVASAVMEPLPAGPIPNQLPQGTPLSPRQGPDYSGHIREVIKQLDVMDDETRAQRINAMPPQERAAVAVTLQQMMRGVQGAVGGRQKVLRAPGMAGPGVTVTQGMDTHLAKMLEYPEDRIQPLLNAVLPPQPLGEMRVAPEEGTRTKLMTGVGKAAGKVGALPDRRILDVLKGMLPTATFGAMRPEDIDAIARGGGNPWMPVETDDSEKRRKAGVVAGMLPGAGLVQKTTQVLRGALQGASPATQALLSGAGAGALLPAAGSALGGEKAEDVALNAAIGGLVGMAANAPMAKRAHEAGDFLTKRTVMTPGRLRGSPRTQAQQGQVENADIVQRFEREHGIEAVATVPTKKANRLFVKSREGKWHEVVPLANATTRVDEALPGTVKSLNLEGIARPVRARSALPSAEPPAVPTASPPAAPPQPRPQLPPPEGSPAPSGVYPEGTLISGKGKPPAASPIAPQPPAPPQPPRTVIGRRPQLPAQATPAEPKVPAPPRPRSVIGSMAGRVGAPVTERPGAVPQPTSPVAQRVFRPGEAVPWQGAIYDIREIHGDKIILEHSVTPGRFSVERKALLKHIDEVRNRPPIDLSDVPEEDMGGFDRGEGWYIRAMDDGRDLGEGPWDTREDAQDFLDAEVGIPATVEYRGTDTERLDRAFAGPPPAPEGAAPPVTPEVPPPAAPQADASPPAPAPETPSEPQPPMTAPAPPPPTPAPETPVLGEGATQKQPWEMRLDDYMRYESAMLKQPYKSPSQRAMEWHKGQVRDAIVRGDPVPPEVLADYPDLAAKAKAEPAEPAPAPVPPVSEPSLPEFDYPRTTPAKGTPERDALTARVRQLSDAESALRDQRYALENKLERMNRGTKVYEQTQKKIEKLREQEDAAEKAADAELGKDTAWRAHQEDRLTANNPLTRLHAATQLKIPGDHYATARKLFLDEAEKQGITDKQREHLFFNSWAFTGTGDDDLTLSELVSRANHRVAAQELRAAIEDTKQLNAPDLESARQMEYRASNHTADELRKEAQRIRKLDDDRREEAARTKREADEELARTKRETEDREIVPIAERAPQKKMNVIGSLQRKLGGGTTLKVGTYEGNPYYTDNHFILRGEIPREQAIGEMTEKQVGGFLRDVTKAVGNSTQPVAFQSSPATNVSDLVWFDNGVGINAAYYDWVMQRYPKATWRGTGEKKPLAVYSGDDLLGAVAPVGRDTPAKVEGLIGQSGSTESLPPPPRTVVGRKQRAAKAEAEGQGAPVRMPEGVGKPLTQKQAPARIKPAPIPTGKAPDPDEIVIDFVSGLGTRVRPAKTGRWAGTYFPASGRTTIKFRGDIDTTAHELMHNLDDEYGLLADWNKPRMKSPYDDELSKFWWHGSARKSGPRARLSYKRAEGLAEYLRAYVMNPDEAKAAAPTFHAYLEQKIPKEIWEKLDKFSDGVRKWAGASATERIGSNIEMRPPEAGTITQRLAQGLKDVVSLDAWKTQFIDYLWPVAKGIQEAKAVRGLAGRVLPKNDPEILMRLHSGMGERFERQLQFGPLNSRNEPHPDIGGLDWLLEPGMKLAKRQGRNHLTDDDLRLVSSYMIAERTLEKAEGLDDLAAARMLTGVGKGLYSDLETAQQALAEIRSTPELQDILKEMATRYRSWADHMVLRPLLDTGRISKQSYDNIKAANEFYVDMHRVIVDDLVGEPGEEFVRAQSTAGISRKLGVARKPIDKFKGSTRKINNPYINLLMSAQRAQEEAMRNNVLVKFRDLLTTNRGMYEGPVQDLDAIGSRGKSGDKNTIPIYIDGKAEFWQFSPAIYNSLKDWYELRPTGALGTALSVFETAVDLTRRSIVLSPPFMVRNFMRDAQARGVISDFGSTPWDSFRKPTMDEVRKYQAAGGGLLGHYLNNRVGYYRAMSNTMRQLSRKNGHFVFLSWGEFAESYKALGSAGELRGRMGEFRRAHEYAQKELGYDDLNASLYAANAARGLLDFAVAGRLPRQASRYGVPFLSANIRGVAVTAERFRENPALFMAKWAAYVGIPGLMLYAWNTADEERAEEYRNLPAWQRDMYWNVKVGPNQWAIIPKPFELGVMASGMERLLDHMQGDEHAFDGYAGNLARSMLPADVSVLSGPFFSPLMAWLGNKDLYSGADIVPWYEKGLSIAERPGAERASPLGRLVSRMMLDRAVDPRQVDTIVRDMFGYFGRAATTRELSAPSDFLQMLSVVRQSPAISSRDAKAMLDYARSKSETATKPMRDFFGLVKLWRAATTDDERDVLAKEVRNMATGLLDRYETEGTVQPGGRGFADLRDRRRQLQARERAGVMNDEERGELEMLNQQIDKIGSAKSSMSRQGLGYDVQDKYFREALKYRPQTPPPSSP